MAGTDGPATFGGSNLALRGAPLPMLALPCARRPLEPMRRFLPFVDLRSLTRAELGRDLMAALAVTFMAVPQGVAYALIAGLPPAAGLYATVLPTIIGSLFRSSRHVVAGPSNAVSLLVGGGVAALNAQLGASPVEIAISLALAVGVFQVAAGLLRLGSVVDYISAPVVLGYITGAGVLIGVGQLPNLTGSPGGSGDIVSRMQTWAQGLDQLNPTALGIGVAAAVLVVGIRRVDKRLPSALLGLVLASVGAVLLGLDAQVRVVGDLAPVPASLPPLTVPTLFDPALLTVAFATTVLSLVESSAVGRSIADRTGDRLDLSVEFFGQGLSNISAAFTGGYPVSGSLSRSALNHTAGAQTRMAGVLAGVLTALVLLLAGPLFDRTPVAALAGLLVVVAVDLVKMDRIRQAFRAGWGDGAAFVVTLIGTWTLRLDTAIYVGVVVSIVLFLRRARLLVVRELAVDETGRLRERKEGRGGRCGAVRVLHIEGTLFFGAAGELRDALTEAAADPEVKALVVRLKRTRGLDLTAATVFSAVAKNLEDRGKHLILVGMRPALMGVMERTGVVADVGEDNAFPTQPGWFEAMDDGLRRGLELAGASEDSPLHRYLALREERAAEAS